MRLNNPKRIQSERSALVRNAVFSETLIRVSCVLCGLLGGAEATHTGAIDHARTRPGHDVTTQTLQAVLYKAAPGDTP